MPNDAIPSPQGPDAPSIADMVDTMGEDGLFGALEGKNLSQNPVPPVDDLEDEDDLPNPDNDGQELGDVVEDDVEEEDDDDGQLEPAAVDQTLDADQFAAMLGLNEGALSVDDNGQVLFKAKVNGEVADVPLKDLATSYQIRQALDQKSNTLTLEHRDAMQQIQQQRVQLEQQLGQAEQLAQMALSQVMQDFQGIDWDQLKTAEPARYAALRQDYGERYQRIQHQLAQVQQDQQQLQETQQAETQQAQQAAFAEEVNQLMEKLPEWQDDDVRVKDQALLRDYLGTYDYPPEAMQQIRDHRWVLILRKAMMYDQLQSNTKVAKKKVASVPKVVKPGAKQSQSQQRRANTSKAMKRLRKTGHERDAAAVLEGFIGDDF